MIPKIQLWLYSQLEPIKIIATITIVIAVFARSFQFHLIDLIFSFIGTVLWAYVAFVWKEQLLLMLNLFLTLVLIGGMIAVII
jgi:hypothetical protein